MAEQSSSFEDIVRAQLGERLGSLRTVNGETTVDLSPGHWLEAARILRDGPGMEFEQLVDLCAVDYLGYGEVEWETGEASAHGFSRGVQGEGPGRFHWAGRPRSEPGSGRFAVVAHLLSIRNNRRLRLRAFCEDDAMPVLPSLIEVWRGANWFEREAFDLFGILFEGHPDLRRILTDYGFVGHPFRKDFPLIGNVEVRYDPERGRVVYEPVSIQPRVLVPRVVRDDSRLQQAAAEQQEPKA